MATRKTIRSKQQYLQALDLEKAGDTSAATKLYQKATATDPLNVQAWNRMMILYRKTKSKQDEIALIKSAIGSYTSKTEADQNQWLKENQQKADSSRALAQVLGLLEENGLPASENDILEKWQTRLYLLEYRLKNARKKNTKATKKTAPASPAKSIDTIKAKKPGLKQKPTKKQSAVHTKTAK